ncbi:alpha-amylase family glycosyl hydrolase [Georgenia sp. SUBG003]|uniref:alpha-amylase family glycosyl hydrolase n=1 Tax=Georgenia sp. SUBG003 TaxID=1497974 RepID=UPI000AB20486
MTTWHQHAIFWHVYPLGFVGAEPVLEPSAAPVHRLGRLTGWLDHAVALGASGLLLGPVFTSHSHGYDTVDHFTIDPRLGDRADFDALVAAAHDRGLKVVLDGVFNHVGSRHPAFLRALDGGPGTAEAELFRLTWPQDAAPGGAARARDLRGPRGDWWR